MGSSFTPHTQNKRLLRLFTPLGDDVLIPLGIDGSEAMSDGFTYTLQVFSETRHDLRAKDLVGKGVTFALVQEDDSLRYVHGLVTELTGSGRSHGGQRSTYELTLRPWLHLLDNHSDCRVFQEQSVPDVLKQLFAPLGEMARFQFDLRQPHEPYRYLTQYNETTGNFVRRLLRMDGIGFIFEHTSNGHTVRFFDDPISLPRLAPESELKLQSGTPSHDHLHSWHYHGRFAGGRFAQRSYNYKQPAQPQEGDSSAPATVLELTRAAELEQYRYAESFNTRPGGQRQARHQRNRAVERHQQAIGAGSYRQLQPGRHFSVTQVPAGKWNYNGVEFTLTRVTLEASDNDGHTVVNSHIEALPRGAMLYPETTPVTIASLQTAVVTGPEGEEVFTDELGRIKVRFHWDRADRGGESSSCWLRVMQPFAGTGFGAHFTPRIGHEVVVAFENGNPDRPFVMGGLYHTENAPPYTSRQGQRAGLRTASLKNGSIENYNELYFDDEKGQEEIYLQAERDINLVIKRNETRHVGVDKAEMVANNHYHEVGKVLEAIAGTQMKLQVGGSTIELTSGKIYINAAEVIVNGSAIKVN